MSDIDKVRRLRDESGLSLGQIKKALDETKGDEAKAREVLSRLGADVALKKSSRSAGEGIIDAYVHNTGKVGVIVKVLCETDFVAKNQDFKDLAHSIAMHIAAMKPSNIDKLLGQPFIKDQEITIKDLIHQAVAKLGENIKVDGFEIFEV